MTNNEPIVEVCTKIVPIKSQNLEWKLDNFDLFINAQINLLSQKFGPFFEKATELTLNLHNDDRDSQKEAKITLSVVVKNGKEGSNRQKMNLCGQIWFQHSDVWSWNFFIPIDDTNEASTTFTFPTNLLESNSSLVISMQYVSRQFQRHFTLNESQNLKKSNKNVDQKKSSKSTNVNSSKIDKSTSSNSSKNENSISTSSNSSKNENSFKSRSNSISSDSISSNSIYSANSSTNTPSKITKSTCTTEIQTKMKFQQTDKVDLNSMKKIKKKTRNMMTNTDPKRQQTDDSFFEKIENSSKITKNQVSSTIYPIGFEENSSKISKNQDSSKIEIPTQNLPKKLFKDKFQQTETPKQPQNQQKKNTKNASTDTIKPMKSKFQQTEGLLHHFNKEKSEPIVNRYFEEGESIKVMKFIEKMTMLMGLKKLEVTDKVEDLKNEELLVQEVAKLMKIEKVEELKSECDIKIDQLKGDPNVLLEELCYQIRKWKKVAYKKQFDNIKGSRGMFGKLRNEVDKFGERIENLTMGIKSVKVESIKPEVNSIEKVKSEVDSISIENIKSENVPIKPKIPKKQDQNQPPNKMDPKIIVVYDVTVEDKKQKEAEAREHSFNIKKSNSVISNHPLIPKTVQKSKPIQIITPTKVSLQSAMRETIVADDFELSEEEHEIDEEDDKIEEYQNLLKMSKVNLNTSPKPTKTLKVNPTTTSNPSFDPLTQAMRNDEIELKKTREYFQQISINRAGQLGTEDLFAINLMTYPDNFNMSAIEVEKELELERKFREPPKDPKSGKLENKKFCDLLAKFQLNHKELCEYLKRVAIEFLKNGQKWQEFELDEFQGFMVYVEMMKQSLNELLKDRRTREDFSYEEDQEVVEAKCLFHRFYSGFANPLLDFSTEIHGHVSILKHLKTYEVILEQMHSEIYKLPGNRNEKSTNLAINLPILKERLEGLKSMSSQLFAPPDFKIQKFNDDFAELEGYMDKNGKTKNHKKQQLLQRIDEARLEIFAETVHQKRKAENLNTPNEFIQQLDMEYRKLQGKIHEISTYLCMGNFDPLKLASYEKELRHCCNQMDVALQSQYRSGQNNLPELQHYANYRSNLRSVQENLNFKLMPWRIFLNHLNCIPSTHLSCSELLEGIRVEIGQSKKDGKEVIRTLEDIDLTLKETSEQIFNARRCVYLTPHARRHILVLEDEQSKLESICSKLLSQLRLTIQCYPSSGPWISAAYLSPGKNESIQAPNTQRHYVNGPILT